MTTVNTLEDTYKSNPVLACRKALKKTANIDTEERLQAINDLLRAYGTEAIRGDWQNGYWCDIVACYVNMGDSYATTVIQVRDNYGNGSRFIVSTIGDFVEKYQSKYNII